MGFNIVDKMASFPSANDVMAAGESRIETAGAYALRVATKAPRLTGEAAMAIGGYYVADKAFNHVADVITGDYGFGEHALLDPAAHIFFGSLLGLAGGALMVGGAAGAIRTVGKAIQEERQTQAALKDPSVQAALQSAMNQSVN